MKKGLWARILPPLIGLVLAGVCTAYFMQVAHRPAAATSSNITAAAPTLASNGSIQFGSLQLVADSTKTNGGDTTYTELLDVQNKDTVRFKIHNIDSLLNLPDSARLSKRSPLIWFDTLGTAKRLLLLLPEKESPKFGSVYQFVKDETKPKLLFLHAQLFVSDNVGTYGSPSLVFVDTIHQKIPVIEGTTPHLKIVFGDAQKMQFLIEYKKAIEENKPAPVKETEPKKLSDIRRK